MAWPRMGLLVGAGLLLTATSALCQGGDLSPPATAGSPTEATPAASDPGSAVLQSAQNDPPPETAPEAAEDTSAAPPQPEPPRQLPFVTLDQARLFNNSLYGQRLLAELETKQTELAAENRRIEAELAEKERALTERRPRLSAEAFRRLADDFNGEVERYRGEQAAKERELYQTHERNRILFQDLANQAMAGLLRERGVLAIIAEEAIVLGFRDLDITEDAIARLDALVGDGSSLPQPGQISDPSGPDGNQTPDQTSD